MNAVMFSPGWRTQVLNHLMANGMTDEGKMRSILLNACGTPTYNLIKTLVAPAAVTDVTFDEIAALVQTHYQPKPSISSATAVP